MNVQALLHDSPSDQHRRPRNDTSTNEPSNHWFHSHAQRPPQSPPRQPHPYPPDPSPMYHSPSSHPAQPPVQHPRRPAPPPPVSHPPSGQTPSSSAHPSPAMASLRPIDSPIPVGGPGGNTSTGPTPPTAVGLRMPTPTPLTTPSGVTGPGVWGADKSTGSDFLKEREPTRDVRDWDRDQRDRARDHGRDRERPPLHPPHPPPPPAPFGESARRKNTAMEVNGPLAGPGVPVGPGIPGSDDLPSRSLPRERNRAESGASSRRSSICNSTIDVGKTVASPTEDELRGREPQQRLQEIQLKERVREPSRERDHQGSRDRREYINSYHPWKHKLDGPGLYPNGEYRPPPFQSPRQAQHQSMRDGGRTTPKAELVVPKHSTATTGPGVPGERDRNERERERDRERERVERIHPSYGVIGDQDRGRDWEREREQERINMGMVFPDRDRERGPPPPVPNVPPHSSHPPPLPLGHGGHSHSLSHSHGHSHHSQQHHSQHREQGSHSHSLHPVNVGHHHPPSSAPPPHQPHQPPPHKGPPHSHHGHSSSRHSSHLIHHPQPQPPQQIQLLPHPQPPPLHAHIAHPHPQSHSQGHPHGHSSHPPPHPPSSQPHSPHPSQMHGPPPPLSQPHPSYRSQPPSQPPVPGPAPVPSSGGMSPRHHHHPTPPSQPSSHHHQSQGPPPPQRQFQSQFHTQFIPGLPQPGSRMGSPVPGQMMHKQQQQQQQQQQQPSQQQRGSMQPQAPPGMGGPPLGQQQQQQIPPLSTSASKGIGLGLSGVPGLEPPESAANTPRPRGSRTGTKTGDRALDKNGRRSYMDVDEMEGVEDPESDVDHTAAALAESEVLEQEEREVKARVMVNLGTFVYPKLPFPYFFDLGRGIPVSRDEKGEKVGDEKGKKGEDSEKTDQAPAEMNQDKEAGEEKNVKEEKENKDEQINGSVTGKPDDVMDVDVKEKVEDAVVVVDEDKNLLDLETRVTVIIPNGHIPLEKPVRPRIWGGGRPERVQEGKWQRTSGKHGRPSKHTQDPEPPTDPIDDTRVAVPQKRRRRRIYTDDSDLFLCALHSGWVTWSGAARSRAQGKDMKLELRIIRCLGATGSARLVESLIGKEEVIGRFLGGRGERCFNDAQKVQKEKKGQAEEGKDTDKANGKDDQDEDGRQETVDEEEDVKGEASDSDDDGRALESAAWGSGHDGSGIEVLGVEFVERGTARTSAGLGLRNRAQRMWEYNERRMTVLGFGAVSNVRGSLSRLGSRKRRRTCDRPLSYPRRLPNAMLLDVIPELDEEEERGLPIGYDCPEERAQTNTYSVVFGTGKAWTGFRYVPSVLRELLFPGVSTPDLQPPMKRQKVDDSPDIEMVEAESNTRPSQRNLRPVVLLTKSEQYLLSPCSIDPATGNCKYDVSLIVDSPQPTERKVAIVNGSLRPPKSRDTSVTPTLETSQNHTSTADDADPSVDNTSRNNQEYPSQTAEFKTIVQLLKSGVGQSSIRLLRDEVVIDDKDPLRIRISSWRWGAPLVAN